MKNDIGKGLVKELCLEYVDVILVGLEEYLEDFPYLSSTIDYINSLHKKGIYINLNDFNENIINNIYSEMSEYIAR